MPKTRILYIRTLKDPPKLRLTLEQANRRLAKIKNDIAKRAFILNEEVPERLWAEKRGLITYIENYEKPKHKKK